MYWPENRFLQRWPYLRHLSLDGVICGHIHRPEIREVDGIRYCNDGDWVEHCSALVEDRNGRLALIRWTERADVLGVAEPAAAPRPVAALDTAA